MPHPPTSRTAGAKVVVVLAALLVILHHDFWWWNDGSLVLGFLPVSLAYHAVYSLATGALWWLAVTIAWPARIEAWADESNASDAGGESRIAPPNQVQASEADA